MSRKERHLDRDCGTWAALLVSLGIATICITSRFIPKRGKHTDGIAVPITYGILVFALIAAFLSGRYTAIQAQSGS